MTEKECNALIPLPAGTLENIGSGPKSILSGMVSDALALARVREKPADTTTKFIILTAKEWQKLSPGMTDEAAQKRADNPPEMMTKEKAMKMRPRPMLPPSPRKHLSPRK